jgi:quinol monooxygenase YgiN
MRKIDKRTIGWPREKDLFQTMIIAITIMSVLPEKQKEVLQTLLSMVDPPGKEKGCLSYGIFCDIEEKNVFNLISEWETRRHLDLHMKSDRFSVLLGTKSLLCEPMKIQILTVSDSEGIEAVDYIRKSKKLIFSV